ncbi:MAG: hypothetical protein ACFFG0_17705 [Candidatus Thorarchaeota archaeon]
MNEDNGIYSDDLKELKKIADIFKTEIERTYKLVEEFYSSLQDNEGIKAQDLEKLVEMAVVYLMRYIEIFNRDFFVEFFTLRPMMMVKSLDSKKDEGKLKISYYEILEDYIHGDPLDRVPRIMAEKMYNEIFSYEKFEFAQFIKKLLNDFLELDFSNECKIRRFDFSIALQNYKKFRNAIIHGNDKLGLRQNEYSAMELKTLIIEYIRLVEELIYPKYFKKPETKEDHIYLGLDEYDDDNNIF